MNNSGDAAEQIVRMSLETTEIVLRLSGSAGKNVTAAIYSVLKNKDKNKIKGRQRLTAMLKSGKELKVFTVSEEHLKQFAREAKRYGVVYCALRGKEKTHDGLVDVMVRAEDAAKINRIVERFKLATVDAVSIKKDIEKKQIERGLKMHPDKRPEAIGNIEENLLEEMLSGSDPVEEQDLPPKMPAPEKSVPQSELTLEPPGKTGGDISEGKRRSVREQLDEIRESRRRRGGGERIFDHEKQMDASTGRPEISKKYAAQKGAAHKQPPQMKATKKER